MAGKSGALEAAWWRRAFVAGVVASAAAYGANLLLSEVRSGNVWGLSYGIAATVLMVGALLFAVRRRTLDLSSRLRLGRSQSWLYFHVYGGTLFLLLVLMHSGFRLPRGTVTGWLYALSVITVASGFVGLVLNRSIPKMLSSGLSTEVHYDRIPELVEDLRQRARTLAGQVSAPVANLYREKVARELEKPRRSLRYCFDVTGSLRTRMKEFDYLRKVLPDEERSRLDELAGMYRTKLEIDAHYTLQHALRVWLFAHAPVSLLLLGFLVLHLYAVYYW